MPRFEGFDLARVLHGERDLVLPLEERLLAEGIYLEALCRAVGRGQRLAREVDGDGRSRPIVELATEARYHILREHDGEHPVLEAVLEEDVAERGADDAAEARAHERPHCRLARGAAAEVLRRHEDLRVTIGYLIEDEVPVLRAVRVEAHVVEEVLA